MQRLRLLPQPQTSCLQEYRARAQSCNFSYFSDQYPIDCIVAESLQRIAHDISRHAFRDPRSTHLSPFRINPAWTACAPSSPNLLSNLILGTRKRSRTRHTVDLPGVVRETLEVETAVTLVFCSNTLIHPNAETVLDQLIYTAKISYYPWITI
jgi:hypothetical protein